MKRFYFILLCLTLFTPFYVTQEIVYPFITAKALFFRSLILLTLPVYAYLVFKDRNLRPNYKNPVNILLVLFLAINFVSAFRGVNLTRSLWGNFERMGGAFNLLSLVLLYFYLLTLGALKGVWLRNFLKLFAFSGTLTAVYALWTYAGLPGFFVDASLPARASSFFGNPIFFASFLVIPLFFSAYFACLSACLSGRQGRQGWQSYHKKQRIFWYLGAVLQLVGIYISGTRGALVGVAAAIFLAAAVYLIFAPAGKIRRFGTAGMGGLIIIVGLLLAFSSHLPAGRHGLPQNSLLKRVTNLNDSNTKARLIQWKMVLRSVKDHPVLGVGPENYNVVANKYFDPAIYQYDSSWFDRPHNYQLELLATTGVLGLLLYLCLIATGFWLLYKAFRKGFLDLFSFSALLAGFAAYQVQNLFVFDTMSASLAFFIFAAFLGYLWEEVFQKSVQGQKKLFVGNTLPAAAFVAAAAFAVYVFVFLIMGNYRVMRDLNYGVSTGVNDIPAAQKYFEKSFDSGFNFDKGENAVKFTEFIIQVAQDYREKLKPDFVSQLMQSGIDRLLGAAAKPGNNPIYWYQLGNLYTTKTYIENQYNPGADYSQAIIAINKSIALAPKRVEPKYFLVPILTVQKKYKEAVALSEEILKIDHWSAEPKWRLALVYQDAGRHADALILAEEALKEGYHFKLAREARWLINANVDSGNYQRAAELYEEIILLSPNDYQLYANLASVYAKLGQKDKAIKAAQKVLELEPRAKADVEAFLKTLQ